jgi:Predicted oxidoreductases (related to aryl-alcohol dehydrogenases)
MDPDISIVIPGARTVEQVEQNAKSWDIHLSKEDYQAIDAAFADFK